MGPDVSEAEKTEVSLDYFESAFAPCLIAGDLKTIDFSEGAPTTKLTLTDGSALHLDGTFFSGKVSEDFQPAEPFKFPRTVV